MRKRRVGTVLRAFACLRGPFRLCRIFFGDTPLDMRLYSGYTTIRHLYTILTYPRWSQPSKFLPIWRLGAIETRLFAPRTSYDSMTGTEMQKIVFDGKPPYEPLIVEKVGAEHKEGEVELELHVDTGESVARVVPVLLRLTAKDAQSLATLLGVKAKVARNWLNTDPGDRQS